MPRYIVSFASSNDIETELVNASSAKEAATKHTWISRVYRDLWIQNTLLNTDDTFTAITTELGFQVWVQDLDEMIMDALNDGDSLV